MFFSHCNVTFGHCITHVSLIFTATLNFCTGPLCRGIGISNPHRSLSSSAPAKCVHQLSSAAVPVHLCTARCRLQCRPQVTRAISRHCTARDVCYFRNLHSRGCLVPQHPLPNSNRRGSHGEHAGRTPGWPEPRPGGGEFGNQHAR